MTKDVVTIGPGHGVRHAVEIMLAHRVSGLPVIGDDGRLVGILTEGDLLRRVELGGAPAAPGAGGASPVAARAYLRDNSWCVADVMTRTIHAVDEDAPLDLVAALMVAHGCKRIPVTRKGRLVGMVSRADLLGSILRFEDEPAPDEDAALRRAIETRLQTELGLPPAAVTVTVQSGLVVLAGAVASAELREAARVVAESLRADRSVMNRIAIEPAASNLSTDRTAS